MFKHKKRMIILISILLVAGFLLTSLASYFVSLTSLRDQVTYSELPLTSDNVYSEIQRDFLRPVFVSSLMASDTFLRDWVLGGEQDIEQVSRYLWEIKEKYNAVTAFFVSEESRTYYYPGGILKQVTREDFRDAWYFRVQNMTTDYEINVDLDSVHNNAMTIFINYRVYDYNHNLIGVTGVGLAVDAVKRLIDKYQKIYSRDILFIDNKGSIQLSSTLANAANGYEENLKKFIRSDFFLRKITSRETDSFQAEVDGQAILLSTRYIKEFDWYLLVMQRGLKGDDQLLDALLVNLVICAVVTFIVVFIISLTISSYQQDIERIASTDKLTGMLNRQALDVVFEQLMKKQKKHWQDLTVILLDFDYFKQVNDKYGHLAGDAILKHISTLVLAHFRNTDFVCRWGGEEFLVILKGCDVHKASQVAEKLRIAILEHPYVLDGEKISSTVSIGIAGHQTQETSEQLVDRADKALYAAKAAGRNRVIVS